jgi:hypothetical protein
MDLWVGCAACALRQNGQSWTCRRAPTIEGHYSNAGWLSSGMRLEYRPFYGDFISVGTRAACTISTHDGRVQALGGSFSRRRPEPPNATAAIVMLGELPLTSRRVTVGVDNLGTREWVAAVRRMGITP